MTSLGTIVRTLARLRPMQVLARPYARLAPLLARRSGRSGTFDREAVARIVEWTGRVIGIDERSAIEDARQLLDGALTLAGAEVSAAAIERGAFPSRLAEYEFHYRRWLVGAALLPSLSETRASGVLQMWREADERFAASNALFEPYVLARRVVSESLTFGLVAPIAEPADQEWAFGKLVTETAALERLTEAHLAGNHQLTHAAVVATMRLLLSGSSAASVLAHYATTLREQVDGDGFHEERSPNYHLIAIADLRRVRAAAEVAGVDSAELDEIDRRMTSVMSRLLYPDGTLPMFNDTPAVVRPSAAELGIEPGGEDLVDLRASGVVSWRSYVDGADLHLVADFGNPRPTHQPGHQHAAPLAFEICWGSLFITSSGVTTYARGSQRTFERGASAHAALRIDKKDPAEIWAAFRMGRAYRVEGRLVHATAEGAFAATASHDGYGRRRHTRSLIFDGDRLTIIDSVEGQGTADIEVFLPIGPDWEVASNEDGSISCNDGSCEANIRVLGGEMSIEPFGIARRFGVQEPATRIVITKRASLPHEITTMIHFTTGSMPQEISMQQSSARA